MDNNIDNINVTQTPQSHKTIWLWLVVIIVLASIGLIAYQQGYLSQGSSKAITPEEAQKINDFLTQTTVPPITEQEATNINEYLTTELVKPLTPEEKQKILDYLSQ